MALLGADDVVAADPAVAVTAGTHVGILLLERNAGACFGAGRFNAESHGVGRRRLGLDAADRLVDILHQLVDAANADHALGSEHDRRHAVGIAVHVVELAVFGHGVGAGKECVSRKNLTVESVGFLRCFAGASVEKIVVAGRDNVIHAGLLERDRAAAAHGRAGLHQCFDQIASLLLGVHIIRLHAVALEVFERCFHACFHCFIHGVTSFVFCLYYNTLPRKTQAYGSRKS